MATNFIEPPDAAEPMAIANKANPTWYSFFASIASLASGAINAINNFAVIASYVFKFPEAETVTVMMDCNFDWTIEDMILETEVGTANVQLVINGANVGSASGASTVRATYSPSGAVANGQDIALTFSSISSDCENLSVSLRGTRTF